MRRNRKLQRRRNVFIRHNETRGKTYEPCLLFAHAQDTLMTIMSELNLAKELIAFFEIMNKKIEEK